jgi:hypothetical protein
VVIDDRRSVANEVVRDEMASKRRMKSEMVDGTKFHAACAGQVLMTR